MDAASAALIFMQQLAECCAFLFSAIHRVRDPCVGGEFLKISFFFTLMVCGLRHSMALHLLSQCRRNNTHAVCRLTRQAVRLKEKDTLDGSFTYESKVLPTMLVVLC